MKTPRELLQLALVTNPKDDGSAFSAFTPAAMCGGSFYTSKLIFRGKEVTEASIIEIAAKITSTQQIDLRAIKASVEKFTTSNGLRYDIGEVIVFGDDKSDPNKFFGFSICKTERDVMVVIGISSEKEDILQLTKLIKA